MHQVRGLAQRQHSLERSQQSPGSSLSRQRGVSNGVKRLIIRAPVVRANGASGADQHAPEPQVVGRELRQVAGGALFAVVPGQQVMHFVDDEHPRRNPA